MNGLFEVFLEVLLLLVDACLDHSQALADLLVQLLRRIHLALCSFLVRLGLMQPLLELIRDRSSGFAAAVEILGGYGVARMGEVLGEF